MLIDTLLGYKIGVWDTPTSFQNVGLNVWTSLATARGIQTGLLNSLFDNKSLFLKEKHYADKGGFLKGPKARPCRASFGLP
jgi:hypothetical protein